MRIAINGFGRIGRMTARILAGQDDLELVAVNELYDSATMAHLFKYDTVHRQFQGTIEHGSDHLLINKKRVAFFNERNAANLPWNELKVDIVIEATGRYRTHELASAHLEAGAKQVIISAPAADDDVKSVVLGINEAILTGDERIVSNASCTTNCAAPLVQIVSELCDVESCYITTVHSYTGDQRLHDAPHKDLRRGRAAAESIVPTTTGAAKALTKIFPQFETTMGGCGIRVPVPDGSLTDLTCVVRNKITPKDINKAFQEAAQGRLKGILDYTEDPIVSSDVVGNPHSCLVDAQLTSVIGSMVKVVGWYDNEIGYSNRLVDLIRHLRSIRKF